MLFKILRKASSDSFKVENQNNPIKALRKEIKVWSFPNCPYGTCFFHPVSLKTGKAMVDKNGSTYLFFFLKVLFFFFFFDEEQQKTVKFEDEPDNIHQN